jgi:Uma2 family endonuclease
MHEKTQLMTADELLGLPDDHWWYELVEGRIIRMSPPGSLHAVCANRIAVELTLFVQQRRFGVVFPQDSGFLLASDPDTVRAPDVAFVSRERVPAGGIPLGYWPGAPDLAVEVLTANDRPRGIGAKVADYLAHGCRLVWVVDPRRHAATVHRPGGAASALTEQDVLHGDPVLPGFSLPVSDIFEDPRILGP